MIVELCGPSAVGKTTLSKKLSVFYGAKIVDEIHQVTKIDSRKNFIDRQRELIEKYMNRFYDSDLVFYDTGIIELLVYTKYHKESNEYSCKNFMEFCRLFDPEILDKSISDVLIFFSCEDSALFQRRKRDLNRKRNHHVENIELAKIQEDILKKMQLKWPNRIIFIDGNNEIEKVFSEVVKSINMLKTCERKITLKDYLLELMEV